MARKFDDSAGVLPGTLAVTIWTPRGPGLHDERHAMPERTTMPRFIVLNSSPTFLPSNDAGHDSSNAAKLKRLGRRSLVAGVLGAQLPPAVGMAAISTHTTLGDRSTELWLEAGSAVSVSDDAELLRQCERAHALDAEVVDGGDEGWTTALRQISALRPTTYAGLHAKVRLALSMLPFGSAASCPDWVSPDERLVWSLLRDMLALSDGDMS